MQQTTRLVAPNGDHSDHKGPRRYIVEDGARTGFARDGFAERARRGEIEGLPNGPLIVAGQRTGEFWTWNKVGRLVSLASARVRLRCPCVCLRSYSIVAERQRDQVDHSRWDQNVTPFLGQACL